MNIPFIVLGVLILLAIIFRIMLRGTSWTLRRKKPHGAICTKCGSNKTHMYTKMNSVLTFPKSKIAHPRVYYLPTSDGGVWQCKECNNVFKIDN